MRHSSPVFEFGTSVLKMMCSDGAFPVSGYHWNPGEGWRRSGDEVWLTVGGVKRDRHHELGCLKCCQKHQFLGQRWPSF